MTILLAAQHITFPNPPWYPTLQYYGHQDVPSYDPTPGPTTPIAFSRSSGYFAGWAFLCYDGSQPVGIQVSYTDALGHLQPVPVTVYQHLYRPDVQAAYLGACPTVTANEGEAFYPTDPASLPLGTYVFHILQENGEHAIQMTDNFTLDVQQ